MEIAAGRAGSVFPKLKGTLSRYYFFFFGTLSRAPQRGGVFIKPKVYGLAVSEVREPLRCLPYSPAGPRCASGLLRSRTLPGTEAALKNTGNSSKFLWVVTNAFSVCVAPTRRSVWMLGGGGRSGMEALRSDSSATNV